MTKFAQIFAKVTIVAALIGAGLQVASKILLHYVDRLDWSKHTTDQLWGSAQSIQALADLWLIVAIALMGTLATYGWSKHFSKSTTVMLGLALGALLIGGIYGTGTLPNPFEAAADIGNTAYYLMGYGSYMYNISALIIAVTATVAATCGAGIGVNLLSKKLGVLGAND
jgi:hypothetical protein